MAEGLSFLVPDAPWSKWFGLAIAAAAIALAGFSTFRKGLSALRHGRLNINALMSVAVAGAFVIGQWPEAAMVMALYAIAELIEARAVDRARNAISGLLALSPDTADLRQADGTWKSVPVGEVSIGATVRVRPGERVAMDGVVTEGSTSIDQAPVTGESLSVDKGPGDAVYAGTINQTGTIECRVTAAASQSTLARIIHAVEQAPSEQQQRIDSYLKSRSQEVVASVKNLEFVGTISNGRVSTIFVSRAFQQDEGLKLRQQEWGWNALYGKPIHLREPGNKVLLGKALARTLGCRPKEKQKVLTPSGGFREGFREFNCETEDILLSVTTATGQVNSLDFKVSGITDAGYRDIDARYVMADFKDAQTLVNTDRVGYSTLLLEDGISQNKFIRDFEEIVTTKDQGPVRAALCCALLLLAGCEGKFGSSTPTPGTSADGGCPPEGRNDEIRLALAPACASCHTVGNKPYFASLEAFENGLAYDLKWVDPANPEGSGLVKLQLGTVAGSSPQMPPGEPYAGWLADGRVKLTVDEVKAWIRTLPARGAVNEGPSPSAFTVRRLRADEMVLALMDQPGLKRNLNSQEKYKIYYRLRQNIRHRAVRTGDFTREDFINLAQQQNTCHYCGTVFSEQVPPTIDHVIPLSRGGEHTKANIVLACQSCNSRKRDKLLDDLPVRTKEDPNIFWYSLRNS